MPSNFSDVQITDAEIAITSGLYDTDDGIKLKVTGDAHPRIHLTPQGQVKTGDGTETPTAGPRVYSKEWTDGDQSIIATLEAVDGSVYVFDAYDMGGDAAIVFILPAGVTVSTPGSFTAVLTSLTGGSSTGILVYDGSTTDGTGVGPSIPGPQGPGFIIQFTSAGDGWLYNVVSSRTMASSADYDNTESGLTATTVQGALDEIANLLP